MSVAIDDTDRRIVNLLQAGMPVCDRPYAAVGEQLGLDETTVIQRIGALLDAGVLTRFGPMFDAARLGGAFTLCAMSVPRERFDEVADLVNGYLEVAHNYEREHAYNMWFVVGADSSRRVEEVVGEIAERTGLEVINLPKLEEFYVGLRLQA